MTEKELKIEFKKSIEKTSSEVRIKYTNLLFLFESIEEEGSDPIQLLRVEFQRLMDLDWENESTNRK